MSSTGKLSKLTAQERVTLAASAKGLTDSEVAQKMGIAQRTVNFHLANVRRKYGVTTTGAAIYAAIKDGELSCPCGASVAIGSIGEENTRTAGLIMTEQGWRHAA